MTKICIQEVSTSPFDDQKPGTAGLRKKVSVFKQPHYLENFVQCIFTALDLDEGATLVLGGDGRYYNREAIQTITAMALANGIGRLVIGENGLLSTPAASNLIRKRHADGGIILTASHNPGGPNGDFGIKFNTASGGQAPEQMTDACYAHSRTITHYRTAEMKPIDLATTGLIEMGSMTIEIVDPVSDYVELMEDIFDFELIRNKLKTDIRLHFDALNAATGPYAQRIFCDILGAATDSVHNGTPLEDFGGLHPDPNPVDAAHLVEIAYGENPADLLAASDGDGDRNMILGRNMVVSPGDSLAIMAANAQVVPGYRNGIPGVARSMPTSRAVDMVANELDIPLYETPTGWKFFCNLMESGKIALCGEESFGTSSNHTREKDGLWAVLFWLNMMAALEQPVDEIVHNHWARFGRCFFQRRDYFIADTGQANALMDNLYATVNELAEKNTAVTKADGFDYTDPIDGSMSKRQGIRVYFADGGRIVYRLSGTGTSGATLRVYLDKPEHNAEAIQQAPSTALAELAAAAAHIADIEGFTGVTEATAIIG